MDAVPPAARLKRLELLGFKSFASRTVFDFGRGITSIVGPNGSGKSNIADALRWVLGESSGKLMRAKKLEDVIYAGSATRSRAERVEVSLVLDNASGWLPVDTAEVEISRKGARAGDSDYFLNGRRAKLRDIQTILATASVIQNSYAIIGQGLVEQILTLRPEERRQLIEEAADIQRYRLKIEEAEQRLKQTHENVERVNLLVKEIAPRMNQLERQARRAGEHVLLSTQLLQALREHYKHRWRNGHETLTVARASHDQAQAEFLQARVALETVQRELAEITAQLEEQRRESAAAVSEKDRLAERVREVERRLAVARERRSMLSAREGELREELAAVEDERERADAVLSTGDSERSRLVEGVAAARAALQERQAEVSALEQEFRETRLHAVEADAKAKRLQAAAAEMRSRIRRLTEAADGLDRDVERFDGRRRSIIQQLAEHVRMLRGLRGQDQGLLAEASQSGTRRGALDGEVRELRESLAAVEATQNARRGKLEGLEARLKVLEEAQAHGPEEPEGGITVQGALATVYEVLRVPRGLEEAIAAVLAEQIEAFVFEHQADAVAAVEELVRQNGPRVSAIPLDSMKQLYPLSLMKEKGVLGVAARLVKYQVRYEKLVNTLLGRVIIVQDTGTAVRLLKRRLGTIVTVDGIVFDQGGTISGGRAQGGRSFALAYDRDLEALPKEIDRIKRSLDVTEREAEALRGKLAAGEAALAALAGEADGAIERRLRLHDTAAARQQKLAQLKGEMRALMGSIQNIREQQTSYRAQAATLEQERTSLLEEAREAGETAKHLEKADSLFKDRRRVLSGASDEAADALGRVDAELRSLTVQKENAQASLARVEAQVSAKSVQLRGLEMELTTLDETLGRDEAEMARARTELEALLERSQPGQAGTHHLEARQSDLHKQVVGGQNRMFEAERRTLETEAEVRRWETEIENLHQRMTEDGLTLTADGGVRPEKGDVLEIEVPPWLAAETDDGSSGLRPMSGGALIDHDALARQIDGLRAQIRALGPVNVEAQVDYESLRERHDFLTGQLQDLEAAEQALKRAIQELTNLMRVKFETTFARVADNFRRNFSAFFGGGHARLRLTDPKYPSTSGVEIEARPPGKRTHSLSQLSGGEKALTSVSLLFAVLQVNPAPFCVLDEVDAMLDEANVGRFAEALKALARQTQFIVITHNRRTIEQADSIYGISMAPDAASRVLSMRLGDVQLNAVSQN